jgi:hypothetical protein
MEKRFNHPSIHNHRVMKQLHQQLQPFLALILALHHYLVMNAGTIGV